MPKRKQPPEPAYKARLKELEALIHTRKPSAREPRPTSDLQEIDRLGSELYAAYPNEPDVLQVCIRYVPSVSRPAYEKFAALMVDQETIERIPYAICGFEQYYDDAWEKIVTFLEAHPELSAQLLGSVAYENVYLSARAMELLAKRIPELSHDNLADFVAGNIGIHHRVNVADFGRGNQNVQTVLNLAAIRLLDEKAPEAGHRYVIPRIFLLENVRERAADFVLSRPFNWEDCQRIIKVVPQRRKSAWDFALRHKGVSFKAWFEYAQSFERGGICVETGPGGTRSETVKLSPEEWDDLWSVCERIAPTDEELTLVATNNKHLAAKATEKLAAKKNVQALSKIVGHGNSQDARITAARTLLDSDPTEETLVGIIGNVPSLRREAGVKLVNLLPAT